RRGTANRGRDGRGLCRTPDAARGAGMSDAAPAAWRVGRELVASLFSRIREGLAKTAQQIRERLGAADEEVAPASSGASAQPVAGRALAVDTIEALEDALLTADVGLQAT